MDVDALANEIRRVDGSHSLGAAALAEALMPFLTAPPPQRPTIGDIKAAVCTHFGITGAEIQGPSKLQAHVYPRHLAMTLCRRLTLKSFPQIAKQFGNRDHTVCVYAQTRINRLERELPEVRGDIALIMRLLRNE